MGIKDSSLSSTIADGLPSNSMVRTNIYLTQPQVSRLRDQAEASGLSVAEIVRRAIDSYYDKEE